jgi:hypothetical protein
MSSTSLGVEPSVVGKAVMMRLPVLISVLFRFVLETFAPLKRI